MSNSRVNRNFRGVQKIQEVNSQDIYRDNRSSINKFFDTLKVKNNLLIVFVVLGSSNIYYPQISNIVLILSFFLFLFGIAQKDECPVKIPIQYGAAVKPKYLVKIGGFKFFNLKKQMLDPNQLDVRYEPNRPLPGQGIFYLGSDRTNGKQIWFTNDDCRQHFLVLGTTGAGKTELLVGFGANALTWSSGFLLVDGKGDVSVFNKIHALALRFGRIDDLLVLNFMTGSGGGIYDGTIQSNTMNPFTFGSDDSLTQMVVSLMDDAGGDGAMWKGRATAMFTGVMRALVHLRNSGQLDLNVGAIRDHINLRRIIDMADKEKYPDMPPAIRNSISSYLTSLPGYQPEKGHKQSQTTLDQHGYLEMQFTKILGSLADVYGHIFSTKYGEVDMNDVVINRRILMVMLPALEKSGDEVANLGKIVVASLKRMMGFTLGNKIEGSYLDVIEKRLTNCASPFIAICDEVGYYCVEGMDLMAAQARSLGFSMVYAAQDVPGMKKLNDKIVGSIIGNTNIKVIMRIEDPETSKMAIELAGKAYKPISSGLQGQSSEFSMNYRDNMEARFESVDRVDFLDLKNQVNGQAHVITGDKVIRMSGFYADPASSFKVKDFLISPNHLICVPKPSREDLEAGSKLPQIMSKLIDENEDFSKKMMKDASLHLSRMNSSIETENRNEIYLASQSFNSYLKDGKDGLIGASCAALYNISQIMSHQVDALIKRLSPVAMEDPDDVVEFDSVISVEKVSEEKKVEDDSDDDENMSSLTSLMGREFEDRRSGSRRNEHPFTHDDDEPFVNRRRHVMDDDEDDSRDRLRGRSRLEELRNSPRRTSRIRTEIDHKLEVAGRRVDDTSDDNSDGVFRLLADLDFDADKVTKTEVEEKIQQSIAPFDPFDQSSVEAEIIDAVSSKLDSVIPPPSIEDGEDDSSDDELPVVADDNEFISDFLQTLLSDDGDDKKGDSDK